MVRSILFGSLIISIFFLLFASSMPLFGANRIGARYQRRAGNGLDLSTVTSFDINRYLGRWYEIARFDNRFEQGMSCVTADYSIRSSTSRHKTHKSQIAVLNRGYKEALGEWSSAVGRAKFTSQVGRLRLSFFLFFFTDYNILAVGSETLEDATTPYQWALIGDSSSKYLWILARTPSLDELTLEHIRSIATSRGYDISKLVYVEQDCQHATH